jgi:hypothetical protein
VGRRISIANKLAMIAAGYGRTVGGGIMAGAVNKLRLPDHIQQTSPGKVEDPLAQASAGLAPKSSSGYCGGKKPCGPDVKRVS